MGKHQEFEYKRRPIWIEIQLKLSLRLTCPWPRLSHCSALGIVLTTSSDQERITGLFRLTCPWPRLSHCLAFVLCTLPAVIRNRQVVIRGPYQSPCQFRVSRNWYVLAGFRQAKSGLSGIISASMDVWTTASGLSGITLASLNDSE